MGGEFPNHKIYKLLILLIIMEQEKPIKRDWAEIAENTKIILHNLKVNIAINEAVLEEATAQLAKKKS